MHNHLKKRKALVVFHQKMVTYVYVDTYRPQIEFTFRILMQFLKL